MSRLLLELDDLRSDVIEKAQREGVAPFGGDIVLVVGEVADHLVDAVHAQRREVVVERT
ncbi:hypothetical protein D3C71_2050310 [compost metagenome]